MYKMNMKKIILMLLFGLFTFSSFQTVALAKNSPPAIAAEDAVLMDATTGQILYSKNPDQIFPPASTTKLMTALLTLENSKLGDKVIVGKNPPFADGSKAGIRENEELTVKDLLYGLLFVSGNDCADALAEHVGGTMENFVSMMDKRAEKLGLKDTNFVNPNGLYDPDHRSSARDLALIMRELVKHPEYTEIATDNNTYYITPMNNPEVKHPVFNEIKMVMKNGRYYYDGVEGGKTGYTVQSLFSYVVSANRNGQRLIVALHSTTKNYYPDSIKLLDYGYKNFELSKLYSKGDKVSDYRVDDSLTIPLLASDDVYYVKEKGSNDFPQISINERDLKNISFTKNEVVLDANITLNDQQIGSLKLISGSDHTLKPMAASGGSLWRSKSMAVIKILSGIFIGSIFVIVFLRTILLRKIKSDKKIFQSK